MQIKAVHHIAIIASDYKRSLHFYTEILGLKMISEHYRASRQSYKTDLALSDGTYVVELFSFSSPPERVSHPEACGLRHLAFAVTDIEQAIHEMTANGIECEPIRIDEYTGRKFTFLQDPDQLPIELYEVESEGKGM